MERRALKLLFPDPLPCFQTETPSRIRRGWDWGIILSMRLCLRTDLYVGVPVYLWPWVFWQLLQLDLWVEQTGRSVLGAVCKRTGEVFITFTGDDPEEARPWQESDLQALLPNSPLWPAATRDSGPLSGTALSPVHAQPEGLSRNLLRRLCCASSLAGVINQTSPNQTLPLPDT